jgi:hypothetical protein
MIRWLARHPLVLSALCLAFTSPVQAQRTLAVAVGSRIRLQSQADTTWRVGRLAGVASDSVHMQSCDSCTIEVYSLPSLRAVQVVVGRTARGSTVLKGALIGALLGISSGLLYAKKHGCASEAASCGVQYLPVPFLGAAGLAIGAAIGSSFRYDDWRPALVR